MNERIKKFAQQSGAYFGAASKDYFGEEYPAFVSTDRMDIEKFAELILRECISKAEDYGLGCDAVEQLKADFGVE
jgi:glutamine amidotransferase-like uncharacterized protein